MHAQAGLCVWAEHPLYNNIHEKQVQGLDAYISIPTMCNNHVNQKGAEATGM